jgi:hypothetical protein
MVKMHGVGGSDSAIGTCQPEDRSGKMMQRYLHAIKARSASGFQRKIPAEIAQCREDGKGDL